MCQKTYKKGLYKDQMENGGKKTWYNMEKAERRKWGGGWVHIQTRNCAMKAGTDGFSSFYIYSLFKQTDRWIYELQIQQQKKKPYVSSAVKTNSFNFLFYTYIHRKPEQYY